MHSKTRRFRGIALALLLLQAAVGAVFPLVHGPQEAQTLGHLEHLQAPGAGACVPHVDSCQICRTVHAVSLTSALRTRLQVHEVIQRNPSRSDPGVVPSYCTTGPLGSRAPPLS